MALPKNLPRLARIRGAARELLKVRAETTRSPVEKLAARCTALYRSAAVHALARNLLVPLRSPGNSMSPPDATEARSTGIVLSMEEHMWLQMHVGGDHLHQLAARLDASFAQLRVPVKVARISLEAASTDPRTRPLTTRGNLEVMVWLRPARRSVSQVDGFVPQKV